MMKKNKQKKHATAHSKNVYKIKLNGNPVWGLNYSQNAMPWSYIVGPFPTELNVEPILKNIEKLMS